MLKHMISPINGVGATTPVDRINHSLDSYSSERNIDRSFVHSSSLHDRSIYGNGPYVINGHLPGAKPLSEGPQMPRVPNGHVHTPQPSQPLNINIQRLNHSHLSTLSTSKHSLGGGTSSSVSPVVPSPATAHLTPKLIANGGLNISRTTNPMLSRNTSRSPNGSILLPTNITKFISRSKEAGVKEMLTSLGLLCLVSLLLALLSLIFLLKITPARAGEVKDMLRSEQLTIISPDEYVIVYEITLALCSLTLSLNLCCLLVCAVQFLFAVKLVKTSDSGERTNKYLQKSNITRICAVGGFFISIPVFLTGIILYTFIQFHSTPAIITSSLIGAGIIFCGCAMVHNVFVWQMEKTNAVRALAQQTAAARLAASASTGAPSDVAQSIGPNYPNSPAGIPQATLDLSIMAHELSTLV